MCLLSDNYCANERLKKLEDAGGHPVELRRGFPGIAPGGTDREHLFNFLCDRASLPA